MKIKFYENFLFLIVVLLASFQTNAQTKKFCAQDKQGTKYEISLTEGSGTAITRTYSSTGVLKNQISGTFSKTDEGVYGSAYFITIFLPNGNMKFLASYDAEGKIQDLKDVLAGRVFYGCNNINSSTKDSYDDGSKYSFNQEKSGSNGEVKIGNQVWASQNLNIYQFKNGDSIPEAKTNEEWVKYINEKKPAWCYYNNDPLNGSKYGKLYNYYVVTDSRGIAPQGWKIPTSNDWNLLTKQYNAGSRGSREANYLKARGKWATSDISEEQNFSNTSGFTALPGGYRQSNGVFLYETYWGLWWKSDGVNFLLSYDSHKSSQVNFENNLPGLSIRLLKEDAIYQKKAKLEFERKQSVVIDTKREIKMNGSQPYVETTEIKAILLTQITVNNDESNSAIVNVYKNQALTGTINGKWSIVNNTDGTSDLAITYYKQTSGGYESSYRVVKSLFRITFDENNDIISLLELTEPNDKFYRIDTH
jgi:uncharacterized protein (TIGR02145 family)